MRSPDDDRQSDHSCGYGRIAEHQCKWYANDLFSVACPLLVGSAPHQHSRIAVAAIRGAPRKSFGLVFVHLRTDLQHAARALAPAQLRQPRCVLQSGRKPVSFRRFRFRGRGEDAMDKNMAVDALTVSSVR